MHPAKSNLDSGPTGMTSKEIMRVVNRYIGVNAGYLGDFGYRSFQDFYPEYCDLDIDTYSLPGTMRERFISILADRPPLEQAKILRGVLDRFPLHGESPPPSTRTSQLRDEIEAMILRLESASPIPGVLPHITSEVVSRAMGDAETLLRTSGATSGVDRIHTALYGYLLAICDNANIPHPPDASMPALLKLLRSFHPNLTDLGPRSQDIEKVLNSFGNILDALNPMRNRASVAHPNRELLEPEEAMLVINVGRTLIAYLDTKFHVT